jgi:hypothetical protein
MAQESVEVVRRLFDAPHEVTFADSSITRGRLPTPVGLRLHWLHTPCRSQCPFTVQRRAGNVQLVMTRTVAGVVTDMCGCSSFVQGCKRRQRACRDLRSGGGDAAGGGLVARAPMETSKSSTFSPM